MHARALWAALIAAVSSFVTASPSSAQTQFKQILELSIPDANQGIGVDDRHFYAIDDRVIAKYTKSGTLVAKWEGEEDGPIIHLDSAVVLEGRIYCSHSNYRFFPMTSSIEVWDANTLQHIGSHSLGIRHGSLTWLDRYDGFFWGTFANYDRTGRNPDGTESTELYGRKQNTLLVKFDRNWQTLESWIFPNELLDRFEEMSNSGGSWGPDGSLYLTGHDPAEVYKIKFPDAGSVLEVEEVIPANIRGQGIAWDRSKAAVFWGIIRATSEEEAEGIGNRVVAFDTNVSRNRRRPPQRLKP